MDKFDSRTIGLIKEEGVLALSKSKVALSDGFTIILLIFSIASSTSFPENWLL